MKIYNSENQKNLFQYSSFIFLAFLSDPSNYVTISSFFLFEDCCVLRFDDDLVLIADLSGDYIYTLFKIDVFFLIKL